MIIHSVKSQTSWLGEILYTRSLDSIPIFCDWPEKQ